MFVTRIAFIFPLSHIKGFFYSAKIKYPHLNFMKTPKRFHEKDTTDRLAQASIWRNTQLPCVFRWEGSQGLFSPMFFFYLWNIYQFLIIFLYLLSPTFVIRAKEQPSPHHGNTQQNPKIQHKIQTSSKTCRKWRRRWKRRKLLKNLLSCRTYKFVENLLHADMHCYDNSAARAREQKTMKRKRYRQM